MPEQRNGCEGERKAVIDSKFGNVLVIYTGGTIGMKINGDGGMCSACDVALATALY